MKFNEIIKKMNFKNEDKKQLIEYIEQHIAEMNHIGQTAYDGELPNFKICKHNPLTRLAGILFMTEYLYHQYKVLKIPDDVFFNTIDDITQRSIVYKVDQGTLGLSKDDVIWFRHHMNMKLFTIGVLQFQIFHMVYLEDGFMHFHDSIKQEIPTGSPVLNVHIPKGSEITTNECDKAFYDAKIFFDSYFPKHKWQAFLCYSWMLYPKLKEVLALNSNIRHFANRFEIISSCPYSEQAEECIFGQKYTNDKDYPQTTSLQRSVLADKTTMGFSSGIIRRYE
ncbi:MAG: acyltransferase domain-containing protein [Cellulosilyticaceae bacterium]